MTVTLWHNPRCSKSREALALLKAAGVVPKLRLYLVDPPSRDEIAAMREALGLRAIDMMRPKEPAFRESGLTKDAADDVLIDAMAAQPILIERPILFANGKAALGRPPEAVLSIL